MFRNLGSVSVGILQKPVMVSVLVLETVRKQLVLGVLLKQCSFNQVQPYNSKWAAIAQVFQWMDGTRKMSVPAMKSVTC